MHPLCCFTVRFFRANAEGVDHHADIRAALATADGPVLRASAWGNTVRRLPRCVVSLTASHCCLQGVGGLRQHLGERMAERGQSTSTRIFKSIFSRASIGRTCAGRTTQIYSRNDPRTLVVTYSGSGGLIEQPRQRITRFSLIRRGDALQPCVAFTFVLSSNGRTTSFAFAYSG